MTYADFGYDPVDFTTPSPIGFVRIGSKVVFASPTYLTGQGLDGYACDLDRESALASCTRFVIAPSQHVPQPLNELALAVDDSAEKLLVVGGGTDSLGGSQGLTLYRCGLDGTDCSERELAPQTFLGGLVTPTALVAAKAKRLLVLAREIGPAPYRLTLVHCALDGTGCTTVPMLGGITFYENPTPLVDEEHGTIVLVYVAPTTFHVRVATCGLDGSGCTENELSPALFPSTQGGLFAVLAGGRLILATTTTGIREGRSTFDLLLVRCALDGTGCTSGKPDPAIPGASSGSFSPSGLLVDTFHQKLLVLFAAGLYRCELDGTNCVVTSEVGMRDDLNTSTPVVVTPQGRLTFLGTPRQVGAAALVTLPSW